MVCLLPALRCDTVSWCESAVACEIAKRCWRWVMLRYSKCSERDALHLTANDASVSLWQRCHRRWAVMLSSISELVFNRQTVRSLSRKSLRTWVPGLGRDRRLASTSLRFAATDPG